MKLSTRLSIFALLVLALALSACSSPAAAPAEAAASPTEETASTVSSAQPEGCLGTAEDALVDLDCREITIAVENAYLPFNYISAETGEPAGWDYDTWNEICTRLHCTPVFQESAWDSLILSVSNGQYNVGADGITITDDRKEVVDFSDGYINIQQRLLVRKGETRFSSIEEFVSQPELQLGTQANTTNYETATQYLPEDRISAFEQFPFAVQSLISGDVDAVMIDQVAGMGYMGEDADQLDFVGPNISSDQLGFVYPKGSDLIAPVNQAIASMQEDGTLTAINIKYFGPDFNVTYDDIQ